MRIIVTLLFLIFISAGAKCQTFAWAQQLGSSAYDGTTDLATDSQGNVIVTGVVAGTMDIDPGPGVFNLVTNGSYDIFVAKFSAAGSLLWAFNLGSTMSDAASAVYNDADDNIYVGGGFRLTVDFDPGPGVFNMTSAGNLDIFILKIDSDGTFLWAKQIGGTGEDTVEDIITNSSDELHVTGLFTGTTDFDPGAGVQNLIPTGSQDAYILKWTNAGDYIWAKNYGTSGGEFCYDLVTDESDAIYATGLFWGNMDFDPNAGTFFLNAGSFNSKAYLLKWDTDANFVWAKMFGGSLSNASYTIDLDADGNVLAAGSFAGSGDFDPGAGTYTMDGGSNSLYHNMFVIELDSDGLFHWAKNIGTTGSLQAAYAMEIAPTSEIWLTGLFAGTVDFDPGAGNATMTATGSSDGFLLELDNDGNYLFSGAVSGALGDHGNSLALKGNSALYMGGVFQWTNADLDPTSGVSLFSSVSNSNDGFLVKMGLQSCEATYGSASEILCPGDSLLIGGSWESTPGVYMDYLENAAGCDSIVEVTLTSYPDFEILTSATPAPCGSNQGTATVSVNGEGTYDFLWNDSMAQTTSTAIDLEAGTYVVTVTDSETGCSLSSEATVAVDNGCPGDFNLDTLVNVADLLMFVAQIGCEGDCCPFDSDFNNVVNINDLLNFLANFGLDCN